MLGGSDGHVSRLLWLDCGGGSGYILKQIFKSIADRSVHSGTTAHQFASVHLSILCTLTFNVHSKPQVKAQCSPSSQMSQACIGYLTIHPGEIQSDNCAVSFS